MVADYAIGQFRFLERLLLVHGHWCYRRISLMVCHLSVAPLCPEVDGRNMHFAPVPLNEGS